MRFSTVVIAVLLLVQNQTRALVTPLKPTTTATTTILSAHNTPFVSIATNEPHTTTVTSRSAFLRNTLISASAVVASSIVTPPSPSYAKDADPAVKGTKDDPEYQLCVSNCLYECTKPKGDEQKSRKECIPECKQKCASTKQQLMLGSPKPSS